MRRDAIVLLFLLAVAAPALIGGQVQQVQFGGGYAGLDARRQRLVDNWVGRFVKVTGQRVEAAPFYNDVLSVSTKTTFEAVTHALMTTPLTNQAGAALGDALALIAEVDAVRGVAGAASDRQFRLYVRLTEAAIGLLEQSQQFRRGVDNAIYHKGYPINYRASGGVPSIQISIALDKRRADIDVDYRSSMFPVGLFNGHLTSSNSDVRAGNNFDKHLNRWTGFQNWWRGFFGVRQERAPEAGGPSGTMALPTAPRMGKVNIDAIVEDFLKAWLVEGNIVDAMGYVSARSYACLARDSDDPATYDRGVAPFQLMANLKSAYDSLGPHTSLDGLVVGTRLAMPALRVVTQPHHARFVIYSVPDDVAASLDCESQLTPGDPGDVRRVYGNYFGSTFYTRGRSDTPVALLWAREEGYWKIVSWKVGANEPTATPAAAAAPEPKVVRVAADPLFVTAARGFLESWLVRRDFDAAFAYLSPKAYGCYNLERTENKQAAVTPEDAGRRLRASLEESGKSFGKSSVLADILSAAEPVHPVIQVMNHRDSRIFSLAAIPTAMADAVECTARAAGNRIPDPLPIEYGNAFGMTVRFKTRSGEAPVLRLLWRREGGVFRITSYDIELP